MKCKEKDRNKRGWRVWTLSFHPPQSVCQVLWGYWDCSSKAANQIAALDSQSGTGHTHTEVAFISPLISQYDTYHSPFFRQIHMYLCESWYNFITVLKYVLCIFITLLYNKLWQTVPVVYISPHCTNAFLCCSDCCSATEGPVGADIGPGNEWPAMTALWIRFRLENGWWLGIYLWWLTLG